MIDSPASDHLHPDYEVVVCTHNGVPYLAAQLDSILAQRPKPSRVIISDDGSTDETHRLLASYQAKHPDLIRVIAGPGEGIIKNVLFALTHTCAPYVFLADQDDIWLEHKARLFSEQMIVTSDPHLIFSDAWVWFPETHERQSFWKLDGLVPEHAYDPRKLAFHNCIQGASVCINQALIARIKPHPDIAMHDWWMGLIAAGEGRVSIIRTPTLLYRQHSANQVGIQQGRRSGPWLARLRDKSEAARTVLLQAKAYADCYAEATNEEQKAFFTALSKALPSNLLKRLYFLLKWHPVRKDTRRTLTLWLSIALLRCRSGKQPTP
ncbi:glycosyltransferase family 2 protein [Saccharospirillum salsuginis]|uniref:Glycosyltransferase 2-like domain-containing protein n=1 Tax=Saccharospirillum salsuginis TaxID=418750 RepID=A0A918KE19_9GAMM|nr:glycosyltransferase family 2 protein [Saccharospirillum salsuginis]GGX60254.1 hypothetical protein GCM10007392_30350 [Saccharospirillum salsuginis]